MSNTYKSFIIQTKSYESIRGNFSTSGHAKHMAEILDITVCRYFFHDLKSLLFASSFQVTKHLFSNSFSRFRCCLGLQYVRGEKGIIIKIFQLSWVEDSVPWGAPNVANYNRPKLHRVDAFSELEKLLKEYIKFQIYL